MIIDLFDQAKAEEHTHPQTGDANGRQNASDNLAMGEHFQHSQDTAPTPAKHSHAQEDVEEHLQAKCHKVYNEPEGRVEPNDPKD